MADITDLIKNYTKLQYLTFVPEIKLFIRNDHYLHEMLMQELNDEFVAYPEWANVWSGGKALARYILDNPELFAGKTVMDYCSGSGVAGIAAALAGATKVTCVDIDPYALQAIKLNAKANKVELQVSKTPVEADIILVGCPSFKTLDGTFPDDQLELIKSYGNSYLGYKILRDEYTKGFFDSGEFEIITRKMVPAEIQVEGRSTRDVILMSYIKQE
jgi:SAM-dependent methyltransferase